MLRIFLILTGFVFFGSLHAQRLDSFPSTPNGYLTELETYMSNGGRDALEDAFKSFRDVWQGGQFTPEEQARIIRTSNAMLAQRMTPSPYFFEYITTLASIKGLSAEGIDRFTQWHDALDGLLVDSEDRRNQPFLELLKFSGAFFNQGALRASDASVSWYASAPDYTLRVVDGVPVVEYETVDLLAVRKQDSIRIRGASGAFYPAEETFYGRGGTVDWSRFEDTEATATLDSFSFDVKSSLYRAKKVTLRYPALFGQRELTGNFEDKLTTGNAASEGSYPRFRSDDDDILIENIGAGVEMRGGFRLEGTTVYGYGTRKRPAAVTIDDEFDNRRFRGTGELFTIRQGERLSGQRVAASIYFGQDSISHPAVTVRYDIPEATLKLERGAGGSTRNPFNNSLHQVTMTAEDVTYFFEKDSIIIGGKNVVSSKGKDPVQFESYQFFDQGDFRRIQNIASYNPITVIKLYADERGTRELDAESLAQRLDPKYGIDNIKELLYDLVEQGFIRYDDEAERVTLKDKVFHYSESAAKQTDYDALRLESDNRDANGVFTTRNNRLLLEGVDRIRFSPRQRVTARPFGEQVTLLRNRDIEFNGTLIAGFGILNGEGYTFRYDPFRVDMDSVRYFDLYVPDGTMNEQNQPNAFAIGSRIEYVQGALLIDAPKNKSGLDDIEMFPSINTKAPSFVYYDLPETLDSVYTRDSFYFEMDPFNLDRLDKLRPSDLTFDGELVSHNIFEPIRETLRLDPEDQSLGFTTALTNQPTYLGKGSYSGDVSLSNRGFLGSGTLSYLDADVASENIVWRPQQFTANAEEFNLPEDRSKDQPQARGYDVNIDWRPYVDSMYVRAAEAPFEMFRAGVHNLKGTAILTPGGLKGQGIFDWPKAYLTSELMSFGAFSVDADTMELRIRALTEEAVALETSNLNGRVDFDDNVGKFKSNVDNVTTVLPVNRFETSLNEFDWDITGETITFKSANADNPGRFHSIDPEQDDLEFYGVDATFDLKTSKLDIEGVEVVRTSDAFIYPDGGRIGVRSGAVLDSLTNAKIVADTSNQNHVINRATVRILGRKEYRAQGYYEYNIGGREQEILFEEIVGTRVGKGQRSEKASVTRATGTIEPEDNFYIDNKTEFRGDIALDAASPDLQFDGFARLDAPLLTNRSWFSVNFTGNKNNLRIAYDVPLDYKGQQMRTGLFLSQESAVPYPRLVMALYFRKDRPILPVTGLLEYDETQDRFVFGDSAKVVNPTLLRGNRMFFYNADGKIDAEGTLDLLQNLQYNSVDAAGTISTKYAVSADTTGGPQTDAPFDVEIMSGIKLILPNELLRIITLDFQASSLQAPNIEYTKKPDFYKLALSNLFPESKELTQAIQNVGVGTLDLPKKINDYTFLLPRLEMTWDRDYQSFVSKGSQLEMGSIDGDMFNKLVNGYVEYRMMSSGDDRLYLYFKSPSGYFYYFEYKEGVLSMSSDNDKFYDAVAGMKEKDAIQKMKDGETYELAPIDPGRARAFVRRVQAAQGK